MRARYGMGNASARRDCVVGGVARSRRKNQKLDSPLASAIRYHTLRKAESSAYLA